MTTDEMKQKYDTDPEYRLHIDKITDRLRRAAHRPERFRRSAYHEAGHAVEAVFCGFKVSECSIVWRFGWEGDDSLGRVTYEAPKHLNRYDHMGLICTCRIALAGRIAECMSLDRPPRFGWFSPTDLSDINDTALIATCSHSEKIRAAWIRWQWLAAIDDLTANRGAVDAVAKLLLERKCLSEADIRREAQKKSMARSMAR